MRFATVCSGIGAPEVAWQPLGWECVSNSEIEPFPCAVLKHRWPDVPNYGDMTKFKEWPHDDRIDLICGGTPCQSFSVAGLRKGLDDPRGNLMLTYLAVAAKYRPEWLVWENVPGVLSSGEGRDFGALLGGLGQLGYGWAYRVLDAQYIRVDGLERAVPQRRRRVFVVGCAGGWQRAAAVLFEQSCLSGNPAPRREAGKGFARSVAHCLRDGGNLRHREDTDTIIPEVSPAIKARDYKGPNSDVSGDGQPLISAGYMIPVPMTLAIRGRGDGRDLEARQDGTANAVLTPNGGRDGIGVGAVAVHDKPAYSGISVRRLTPTECESLMGLPRNYTAIPWRGKQLSACPDGPRYKALGNSMAVNVVRWIGWRIDMVKSITEQNT